MPDDIGRKTVATLARELADSWQYYIPTSKRKLLVEEIVALIAQVQKREATKKKKKNQGVLAE